jgi:hypothetical protein
LAFFEQEGAMAKKLWARAAMIGMLLGAFTLGYISGSATQQRADAQGLGGLLEQSGKAGGVLGAATQLGSSVVEMQGHVNGLQKNLDTLKQLQSALGGGK